MDLIRVQFNAQKGTVIFELLPEGVDKIKLYNYLRAGIWYGDAEPKGLNAWKKKMPKGFQLIGLTSEVTEEQANMIVDSEKIFPDENTKTYLWSYLDYKGVVNIPYWYANALDSFKSLMEHLQVYEVNPFPEPLICCSGSVQSECGCMGFPYNYSSQEELNCYYEANERTGKWVVLFKEN